METRCTCKCPKCGTEVALPPACADRSRRVHPKRLAQVARAVCGCWVNDMPERDFFRLLEAVTVGAGAKGLPRNRAGGRGF